jgi:hypothetical protein
MHHNIIPNINSNMIIYYFTYNFNFLSMVKNHHYIIHILYNDYLIQQLLLIYFLLNMLILIKLIQYLLHIISYLLFIILFIYFIIFIIFIMFIMFIMIIMFIIDFNIIVTYIIIYIKNYILNSLYCIWNINIIFLVINCLKIFLI